jgi:hypothetical protein
VVVEAGLGHGLPLTQAVCRSRTSARTRKKTAAEASITDVIFTILDSVREDVQAFGRELAQRHFKDEDGPVPSAAP